MLRSELRTRTLRVQLIDGTDTVDSAYVVKFGYSLVVELAGQIERFEQQLTEDPVRAKKEAAVLAELLDKLEQEYFAFFQMPDEYMENFLNWYEDQQEDYDDQGWRTKN